MIFGLDFSAVSTTRHRIRPTERETNGRTHTTKHALGGIETERGEREERERGERRKGSETGDEAERE